MSKCLLTSWAVEAASSLQFVVFVPEALTDCHWVVSEVRVLSWDQVETVELVEQILSIQEAEDTLIFNWEYFFFEFCLSNITTYMLLHL